MPNTGSRKRLYDIMALFLITAVVAAGLLTPLPANGGSSSQSGNSLNASVTVSAKNKSYKIENGILGVDVSKYQGKIDWSKVAQDDVNFAFIRASYATTQDPYFLTNAKDAHSNGVKVGAYHYATFKSRSQMQTEAKFFIKLLKQVNITYPVVLDLEHTSHGLSKANLTTLAKEFMELVEAEGYTVMLYTYQNYVGSYLNGANLSQDFWIANYLEHPSVSHKVWQYSATGKISGISGPALLDVAYQDLSTSKGLQVSKPISDSIKRLINERYGSNLSTDALNFEQVTLEINKAFQNELNRQMEAGLNEDGVLTAYVAEQLSTIPYTLNETSGRITCLLQAKLFYKGHYTNNITGVYDDHTVTALKSFQRTQELEATGELNYATWAALLGV